VPSDRTDRIKMSIVIGLAGNLGAEFAASLT
jgi:hypothetical protein